MKVPLATHGDWEVGVILAPDSLTTSHFGGAIDIDGYVHNKKDGEVRAQYVSLDRLPVRLETIQRRLDRLVDDEAILTPKKVLNA